MKTAPIIGSSISRKDGENKVTGKTRFGADYSLPGQLYAAVYHSPHAHARILSLNIEKARAYPGVRAVITGEDCPGYYGSFICDQPILAHDKVVYKGQPVAAVAADTERIAREAVRLIEAEYEPLPIVDSIEDAIKADALVQEDWSIYKIKGLTHPVQGTNILDRFQLIHGDIDKGFEEADVIVESEYYTAMLQHTVIETHTTLVNATPEELLAYAPVQSPFSVQSLLSGLFGYPVNRVRIVCTDIGAGFGCKLEPQLTPIAAALSIKAKRPIKLTYDRHEEFESTVTRAPLKYYAKTGATKDGKLVAQKLLIYWDTGAFGGYGPRVNYNAGYASNGPYAIPNVYVDSYCMVTNHSLGSAYRGFGITEVACAHEAQMDKLAKALDMDPLEFRLKNVLKDGLQHASGEIMKDVGVGECLEKAAANIGWDKIPLSWTDEKGKLHGKGIACYIKVTGTPSTTSVTVRMNGDGTVNVLAASREMGQGVRTVFPQFVSSVLGIDIDKVYMSQADTSITPYDKTTTSSRSTFHGGNAILEACEDIVRQLKVLVAKLWKVSEESMLFENGVFTTTEDAEKSLHINDIGASRAMHEEPPVIAIGRYGTKDVFDPVDEYTHASKRPTVMWMMGAQAAEVAVDLRTGHVDVVKIGAAHDVGKAINPLGCTQQIEGALSMGLGHALLEEMIYQGGDLKNGNMVDYKVPTFMDADFDYDISLVEVGHSEGPYGAKGIGEPGVAPTAPCISNAVAAALGRPVTAIPIKPEFVLGCEGGTASGDGTPSAEALFHDPAFGPGREV